MCVIYKAPIKNWFVHFIIVVNCELVKLTETLKKL